MFQFVLRIAAEKKLLSGKTVGVDSTTLEANAAMKSIVRQDTGEDWKEYVTRLMREEGVIEPDAGADRRGDSPLRQEAEEQEGLATTSGSRRPIPTSRITKMKDGRTHLAYKAEHVVDLESDLVLAAEIYPADQADTHDAGRQRDGGASEPAGRRAASARSRKWRRTRAITRRRRWSCATALEPADVHPRAEAASTSRGGPTSRTDTGSAVVQQPPAGAARQEQAASAAAERACANGRSPTSARRGGTRRSWLRGLANVAKRYLIAAAAHNLGRILRKLFGIGKPKGLQGGRGLAALVQIAISAIAVVSTGDRVALRRGSTRHDDADRRLKSERARKRE